MKTIVNTRVDVFLKQRLQEMATQMGISLSSLISATLTKLVKDQKLELYTDSSLSKEEILQSFNTLSSSDISKTSYKKIKDSQKKEISEFIDI